jgi:Dolichyl-phosphate-mannose-protein mannosyltransferase
VLRYASCFDAAGRFGQPVRHIWLYFAVIAVVFGACSGITLFTKLPLRDEGIYGTFGRNLLLHGHMANPVVDASQSHWAGVDRANFWTMPLHPVLQAAWYRLFGFSLTSVRSLSLLMGLVGLLAFFRIVRRICGDQAALLASAFVALDRNFVLSAAIGRPDMMIQCFTPSRSVDFERSENHLSAMAEIVSKLPPRNARKFFPFQAYSEPIVSTHEDRASHGGFSLLARGARVCGPIRIIGPSRYRVVRSLQPQPRIGRQRIGHRRAGPTASGRIRGTRRFPRLRGRPCS